MFSSFGFDPKGASRNSNSGSRFFPNASRGFSVHVFKNAAPPPPPPPPSMPPVQAAPKFDTVSSRPVNGGGHWSRQSSYRTPQSDIERKQPPTVAPSHDRRLVHVPVNDQAWPLERKQSKSQKSYGIYPSLTSDVYIYERSISSVSLDDGLASSPSSDSSSSSDSDLFPHTATFASVEISSTRASSSTETLESTLTAPAPGTLPNVVASVPPPPPTIAAPPRPTSTRPQPDSGNTTRPVIPLTRATSQIQRSISISRAVIPPIQLGSAPLDNFSDSSDSDTVVSDIPAENMVVDMLGAHWSGPPSHLYAGRSSTPSRRDYGDRAAPGPYGRDVATPPTPGFRDVPATRSAAPQRRDSPRMDEPAPPRAPPGLSAGVATPPDGSPPRATRDVASPTSASNSSSSRSPTSVPLTRSASTRPSPASSHPGPYMTRNGEMAIPSPNHPPPPTASISSSPPRIREVRTPSPQTSPAGPQHAIPVSAVQAPSFQGSPPNALVVAAAKRNVRWTENLICPSPVPPERRRRGWFNRRGDQLWTNDGQYKAPEPGQEFPLELAHYPEPNMGWMNEEGVRIDLQHRLIPKLPLRSALKRPKQNTI